MEASTRNSIINAGLALMAHVTGMAESLAPAHNLIVGLQNAAPELEDAWHYFQSDEGQRAIKHAQEVFAALAKTLPQHDDKTDAPVAPVQNAGWRLEWDALQGYQWVKDN